jgi:hypothetical protein
VRPAQLACPSSSLQSLVRRVVGPYTATHRGATLAPCKQASQRVGMGARRDRRGRARQPAGQVAETEPKQGLRGLERWQPLLGAVIAAIAAIAVAIIAASGWLGSSGPDQGRDSPPISAGSGDQQGLTEIDIESITLLPATDDAQTRRLAIEGTVTDVPDGYAIYVMGQPATVTPSAGEETQSASWLIAGPARRLSVGAWETEFAYQAGLEPLRLKAVMAETLPVQGAPCEPDVPCSGGGGGVLWGEERRDLEQNGPGGRPQSVEFEWPEG